MMDPAQMTRLGDVLQLKYELTQAVFKQADQQVKEIEEDCNVLRRKHADAASEVDITTAVRAEAYRRWLNEQLKDRMIVLAAAMAKRNKAQDVLRHAFGRKIAFEKMVEKISAQVS